MKSISVGQLRQNPTAMLDDVEAGETYRITRHNREIGRVVPPSPGVGIIAPKRPGPTRLASLPRHEVRTADSLDALLDEMSGDW